MPSQLRRSSRTRLICALVIASCAFLLGLPSSASAVEGATTFEGNQLVIDAPAGVGARNLLVTVDEDSALIVDTDSGIPLPTPSGDCTWNDEPIAIECDHPAGISTVVVFLGDGADRFTYAVDDELATPVIVHGEGGSDTIYAGPGADQLDGGPGDDLLVGNCGLDTFDGGDGRDTVSYEDLCVSHILEGVHAGLDGFPNDGPELENIGGVANSVEVLRGTGVADQLWGGAGADEIYGLGGDDTIDGRAGADKLHGGGDADVIVGGTGVDRVWGEDPGGDDVPGDDSIRVRDSGPDTVVRCGGGRDEVVADDSAKDPLPVDCEVKHQTVVAAGPPAAGSNECPAGRRATKIGSIVLCYTSHRLISSGRYALSGDVTINNRVYLAGSSPITVDVNARSVTLSGAITIGVIHAGQRIPIWVTSRSTTFSAANLQFTVPIIGGSSKLVTAGQVVNALGGGVLGGVSAEVSLRIDAGSGSVTFPAGVSMLDGALVVTGSAGVSFAHGITLNLRGCLSGQTLPIGGVSRVAELRNACVEYDNVQDRWKFSADARLFQAVNAKAGAEIVGGGVNAFDVDLSGVGRAPIPFGAYVDGGGISVAGLRAGSPRFAGRVHGGWPYTPTSVGAQLTLEGEVAYDVGRRELTIRGIGVLETGGTQLANGNLTLKLGLGSNYAPNSLNFDTSVFVFGGFITGNVTASVDNTGFFAAATVTLGFPADAPVTQTVNQGIESVLHCNWALHNWCPYVTGLEVQAQAVVSSKGAGGKAHVGPLHASVWWLARTRAFDYDLGINSSQSLSFLDRSAPGSRFGDIVGGEVFDAETPVATKLVVPKDAQLVALQLEGSTTGEVVLVNPAGQTVVDTASNLLPDGFDFGRDPGGSGAASLGMRGVSLVPGTWSVSVGGAAPFTAVRQQVAGDPGSARVTSVVPTGRGVKPAARRLVAGSSVLAITWRAPAGTHVTLRATTPNGRVSLPIATKLAPNGRLTWRVGAAWAGPLRILAATERDGLPVDSTTYPTTFSVVRPSLGVVAGLRVRRLAGGRLIATWRRASGASAYDVELLVRGRRRATVVTVRGLRATLSPRSRSAIRVRIRPVSAAGQLGRWSRPVSVAPIRVRRRA